jgi:peptidoglycan/LPS O-acetylase OafA/YrhL
MSLSTSRAKVYRSNCGELVEADKRREGMRSEFEMPPGKQRESSGYLPSLDGWRAIAIVGVILFHCRPFHWGVVSDSWLHAWGGRGVDLFFALSGFLICGRLLREEARNGRISMRSFYLRRIFRIQPVSLTYLAVLSALILSGEIYRLDRYSESPWSTVVTSILMVRNIFTKTFFFETAHFWSLSVEEQFYIFLPTFLVLCKRYRLAILASLFVSANIWRVIYLSAPCPGKVFQRTDLVCGAILLGCVFAMALTRPRIHALAEVYLRPWVAIVYAILIFLATGLHHSRTDYVLITSIYPVLITATTLHSKSWTTAFLELSPLRFVGRISFSLYVWQEIFFDPFSPGLPQTFRSHLPLCWVATFGCAIASYYLLERPMVDLGRRLARRRDTSKTQEPMILAQDAVAQTAEVSL